MGVLRYFRFKDDVLIILNDWSHGKAVYQRVATDALPEYVVEREHYGLSGATMLDIWLGRSADDDDDFVHWRPHIKPTAVQVPLHWSSSHQPGTHTAWPVGEMRRLHLRSKSNTDFNEAKYAKIGKFHKHFLHGNVIQDCYNWKPRLIRVGGRSGQNKKAAAFNGKRVIRCILPYHPCLSKHVWKLLGIMNRKWSDVLDGCSFQPAFKTSKTMRMDIIARRGHF